MTGLKIYQVGLGSFGRYGFEKLVEMHRNLEEVDVRLEGVCEPDFEKLEAAEKFAAASGIEVETFREVDGMYSAAERQEGRIMIYDAGPGDTHAEHIQRSIRNGFFHLAEKPPSMRREQHIREKKLAENSDVSWKVDFIERQNPVVRRTVELLEDESIDSVEVFRQSSAGIQKMLQPVKRRGVKGGDILDKMVHEVYVLDFLEAAGMDHGIELQEAEAKYLMPKNLSSDRLMAIDGGSLKKLDERVATGQTSARFRSRDAEVVLNSGWLGIGERARELEAEIEEATGEKVLEKRYSSVGDRAFSAGEARFFVVRGSRRLAGDMLHGKLYDLETGESLETPELMHDQLYRVIRNAVRQAAGKDADTVKDRDIDTFMTALFDARDEALENTGSFSEELEKANARVDKLVLTTGFEEEVKA